MQKYIKYILYIYTHNLSGNTFEMNNNEATGKMKCKYSVD